LTSDEVKPSRKGVDLHEDTKRCRGLKDPGEVDLVGLPHEKDPAGRVADDINMLVLPSP